MLPAQPASLPPWVKPMTIGGVVDLALKLYRQKFGLFFMIALLTQLPVILSELFMPHAAVKSDPVLVAMGSLGGLVTALASIWGIGALVRVASDAFLGKTTTFGEASSVGMKRFFSILWAYFLYGMVIGVPVMLAIGISVALATASKSMAMIALVSAIAVVGVCLYIYFLISCSLFSQCILLEDKRGVASLKRSRQLIRERGEKGFFKNNVWRLSVLYLILGVIWIAVFGTAAAPALLVKMGSLGTVSAPGMLEHVATLVKGIGGIFAAPISLLVMTVFYYDIRIRGEGLDMSLKASTLRNE